MEGVGLSDLGKDGGKNDGVGAGRLRVNIISHKYQAGMVAR
jgi:hypothetical protein